MSNDIVAVDNSTAQHSLKLLKSQEEIAEENGQALQVLHEILDNKKNVVKIKGKRHLEIDDWVAIGTVYGLSLKTGDAEPVEIFDAKGFKAKAEVIDRNTGFVIGGAEAYCLDNEKNWKDRDYFQMASMAQTRAGSKALSNQLKGVVALYKSLSGTPAEEMDNVEPKKSVNPKPKVPTSATMGNKPKAPKSIHDKVKEGVPITQAVDEAIEVEVVAPKEPKKPNLATIIKSNKHIRLAVDELQATETTVDRPHIIDKLQDLMDMGKVTIDEYKEAKTLLE